MFAACCWFYPKERKQTTTFLLEAMVAALPWFSCHPSRPGIQSRSQSSARSRPYSRPQETCGPISLGPGHSVPWALWFNWNQAGLGSPSPENKVLACGQEAWELILPPPNSRGELRKPLPFLGPSWRLLGLFLVPAMAAEVLRLL